MRNRTHEGKKMSEKSEIWETGQPQGGVQRAGQSGARRKAVLKGAIALAALLLALLLGLCACGPKTDKTTQGTVKPPKLTSFRVLRAASQYDEPDATPCVVYAEFLEQQKEDPADRQEVDPYLMEPVVATLQFDNPDGAAIASVQIGDTEYLSDSFSSASPTRVRLPLLVQVPAPKDKYEPEPTSYDFQLKRITYRNGSASYSVPGFQGATATVRLQPSFTVTLDVSQSGMQADETGRVPPITYQVPFAGELGLPTDAEMSPPLGLTPEEVLGKTDPHYYKLGYGFLGWYTQPEGGERMEEDAIYEYFSDITLYARYQRQYDYALETDPETGEEYAVITGVTDAVRGQWLIYVPALIDGYPVRKVGEGAFTNAWDTTCIYLNEGVDEIRARAFAGLSTLNRMALPGSVTTIGEQAFDGCASMNNGGFYALDLGGVTHIGKRAFRGCGWNTFLPGGYTRQQMTLYIPNTVQSIGDEAFANSLFRWVYFSETANPTCGEGLFRGSTALTLFAPDLSDETPQNRTRTGHTAFATIPAYCFHGCTALNFTTLPDGVTTIGDYAFTGEGGMGGLTAFTLPDSVTTIGNSAFANAPLESLTIGANSSLRVMGDYAFQNIAMTEVHIQAPNLRTWGISPFYGSPVKEVFLYAATPPEFRGKDSQWRMPQIKYFVPRSSVDAYRAEFYYDGIVNGYLPEFLQSSTPCKVYPMEDVVEDTLGVRYALEYYDPDNPYHVRITHVFDHTQTQLVLPETISLGGSGTRTVTVTSVGDYFVDGDVVSEVYLPDTLTDIGDYAFCSCRRLSKVEVFLRWNIKYNEKGEKVSSTPVGTDRWDNVTRIGAYAFYATALTGFTSGIALTEIGDYAFRACPSLRTADIRRGMGCDFDETQQEGYVEPTDGLHIGLDAFNACPALEWVCVGRMVSHIEYQAFAGCSSLTKFIIYRYTLTKVTRDAQLAVKRVLDSSNEAMGGGTSGRITIYLPSMAAWNAYKNCLNTFDKDTGEGTANWTGYTYDYTTLPGGGNP